MICITNDTALRRATKLTDLLDRVFEHIHSLELPAHAETVVDDFEEEYIKINNGE